MNITTKLIEQYRNELLVKAALVASNLKDWAKWEHNGRIYVGYKRINHEFFVNVYSRFNYKPVSALEIVRRKIRKWLDQPLLKR